MTRVACHIAKQGHGINDQVVLMELAAFFATVFPLCLSAGKLSSSFILYKWPAPLGTTIVYSVYTGLSSVAFLASFGLPAVEATEAERLSAAEAIEEKPRPCSSFQLFGATVSLLADPIMLLMVPTNLAFGFVTGFFPSVVTLRVSESHGNQFVGLLYALAGAIQAMTSYVFSWMVIRCGSGMTVVMSIGAVCFALSSGLPMLDITIFAEWPILLMSFAAYGSGQSVWQGPAMALFGAYWPSNPQAAYANLKLHSGLASAIAFFLFPRLSAKEASICCLATVACGIVGYITTSVLVHRKSAGRSSLMFPDGTCEDETKKKHLLGT